MRLRLGWFWMLLVWAAAAGAAAQQPTNIVFILSDDQGWGDIGYNGSEVKTPNLDWLAAEGARLQRHYVYPTCSPTRVALLTGRYPSRFSVLSPLGATTQVTPADMHLPQGLRDLGYTTHITGKWHIGEQPENRPLQHGFDTSYGYLRGQIDPYTHRYKFGDHVTWHRNDEFIEEAGHVTDLITEEAVRVIESAGDKPFFLYVAHHAPHYPLNEPPKWIAPYEGTIEDVWRRHYAASITHMDDQVGRIVEALQRTGKRSRTLIIFSSDNGGQRSWGAPAGEYNGRYAPHKTLGNNKPLRGWKGDLYEGGIRVPAFANWPGVIPAGTLVEAPVHVVDWTPTLIRLAEGRISDEWQLDGQDIWPLLISEKKEVSDSPQQSDFGARSFYWKTRSASAVRHGPWKLIVDERNQSLELFDVARDPNETNELSSQHPEEVKQLQQLLYDLAQADR